MFKENDNMRPGPTPERVLSVCRLLENASYTQSELFQLCQLDLEATTEESVKRSLEAAEELKLIKKDSEKYALSMDKDLLESADIFRRAIAPRIFSNKDSTFFKLTEWYIANSEKVMALNRFDEFAAEAAKNGVKSVTENDILGWRFWMRFLGHAYQYNKTLIPNMSTRLSDVMSVFEKDTTMTCTQFLAWLKDNIPEAANSCRNDSLPLAVSNGLRTLQREGKIELVSTLDAVRVSLYPLRGVDMNEFSDIVIKEIG